MKTRTQKWISLAAVMLALGLGAAASAVWAQDRDRDRDEGGVEDDRHKRAPIAKPLKDARLKIELNATDRDAGIQVFIDSDPWKSLAIFDPFGRVMFESVAKGRFARQGGTELFLESAEPNFSELTLKAFLQRFPEGVYEIVAKGLEGDLFVGFAKFTHNLPDGPVLVSPAEDAVVDPNHTVVRWQPVPPPNGSPIIGYQVLVVKPNTGIVALPKIILDVMMPPTATSLAVPPGFLLPNSEYEWEVLAIEKSGNQTLSVGHFRTP